MTLSGAFPMGMEKWKNALMMMGGVLVGWMVSPVVWLVAGPLRILVLMMAQASQESGYNSTVCGDAGTSCGMLQFQEETIKALGGSNEDRSSPFWSGYYGVRMLRKALLSDKSWWLIGLPIYGFAVLRYMWTHGWGATTQFGYAGAWSVAWSTKGPSGTLAEPRAWGAFVSMRAISLIPIAIIIRCVRKMKKTKKTK